MQMQHPFASALQSRDAVGNDPGWLDRTDLLWNQLAATLLFFALAPVLLVIALLIWRSSGMPLLFGHYRVSQSGRLFRCLKFRTMYADADAMLADLLAHDLQARAEWQRDQKLTHDPRVTPIGRFLRRTSLDELPQLFNVIGGEMRLVGPRPVTVAELERYGAARWHYFRVRPGMTGLWQVSGRNNTTYQERVLLDRRYVEQRSLWLDFVILLRTVKVVLLREGAK